MSASEKVQQLVEQAQQSRLFGEILLRFRGGHLVFVTETKTTPIEEEQQREHRSSSR